MILVGRLRIRIVVPDLQERVLGFVESRKRFERTRPVQADGLHLRARGEREIEPLDGKLVTAFFHEGRADLGVRLP